MTVKRSRWIVWLAGLCLAALTARLGFWQLDRAGQKVALRAQLEERGRAPALADAALPRSAGEAAAQAQRAAVVSGQWLAQHSVYLDNRPMGRRAGFFVLTPLELADGSVLVVQRGWWPRDTTERLRVAVPPPPAGPVRVSGRITPAPSRLFELAPEASGPIRQNLDLDSFARETRLPLRPWVLVQLDDPVAPVADGLLRQWAEPAADVHKHYGYAVQWFALSALTVMLLVWFQLVRPWRRQRASFASHSVQE